LCAQAFLEEVDFVCSRKERRQLSEAYVAFGIKVAIQKKRKGSTKEYSVWLGRRGHLGNLQAFLELVVSK